jgi:Sec-independent protein translocase protein TatA
MDFLGIGPLELFFIVVIALIVLGPKDMIKAGKTIGRFIRNLVTSPNWRTIQKASQDLRKLPNTIMREAGLEDIKKDLPDPRKIVEETGIDQIGKELSEIKMNVSDWTTPQIPENKSNKLDQNEDEVRKIMPEVDTSS